MKYKLLFLLSAILIFSFLNRNLYAQYTTYNSLFEVLLYATLDTDADEALLLTENLKSSEKFDGQYNADLFNNVARTLISLGERKEAKKIAEYGKKDFTDNIRLHEAYAIAELKLANFESAEEYFNKAYKLAVQDTSVEESYRKVLKDQIDLVKYRKVYSSFTGVYKMENTDKTLLVKYDPYQGTFPGFVDIETGQYEILYPVSDSSFYYRNTSGRKNGTITFKSESNKKSLVWEIENEAVKVLTAKNIKFREIEFNSTEARLNGTLILPEGKGPFASVVLVHGAGYLTRYNLFFEALNFVSNGIAAFVYDKHGTGTSTGSIPVETPYSILRDDASNAVNILKNQIEIDQNKIGLWGHSEGGWIVVMTSNENKTVSFDILAAGASVDVFEQVKQSTEINLEEKGFEESEIKKALAYMNEIEMEIRQGATYSEIKKITDTYQDEKWMQYVLKPSSNWEIDLWRMLMKHDAKNELVKVDVPLLAIFGGSDFTVPPEKNIALLEKLLNDAPTKEYKVENIPDANHQFLIGNEEYATQYFNLPVSWIKNLFNHIDR